MNKIQEYLSLISLYKMAEKHKIQSGAGSTGSVTKSTSSSLLSRLVFLRHLISSHQRRWPGAVWARFTAPTWYPVRIDATTKNMVRNQRRRALVRRYRNDEACNRNQTGNIASYKDPAVFRGLIPFLFDWI